MAGALERQGQAKDDVLGELFRLKADNVPTYGPRMFRPSYFAGEDVVEVAETAFMQFIKENWLYGRTSYPALGRFEDEILATLFELFNAPNDAGGILTSGGTESLILSAKIAREHARQAGRHAEPFNIVLPRTAHPALDKAAEMLCLDVRRAPESDGYLADVSWMRQACDRNTIMILGSAPPYPFGQTDPIEDLAQLAGERDLWLHVDACLGGMILPFLADIGKPCPSFDFRVPGVASVSVDLHKFGYAAKGISALVLARQADEAHARTVFSDWPAGLYATPGVAGTRSGGAVASAWAVMRYLGHQGFVERTRKIIGIRDAFIDGLKDIGGRLLGQPDCFHFNFEIEGVDSLYLAEALTDEDWVVSSTEAPNYVQLMVTAAHDGVDAEFCADVKRLSDEIRSGKRKPTGRGAVYSKVVLRGQFEGA